MFHSPLPHLIFPVREEGVGREGERESRKKRRRHFDSFACLSHVTEMHTCMMCSTLVVPISVPSAPGPGLLDLVCLGTSMHLQ